MAFSPDAVDMRVFAAGEQQTGLSAHVGYVAAYPGIRPVVTQSEVGSLGLMGLGLISPLVLYLLWRRPRGWQWAGGCFVALLLLCPRQTTTWVVAQDIRDAMVTLERLSAGIEAEAARTGRWPDLDRWNAAHRADGDGPAFAYTARLVAATRSKPWAALSVRADYFVMPDRRFVEGFPRMKMDSRAFGPDGLYGTADDDPRLVRAFRGTGRPAESWPHGRAPRDPNVNLPPWPEEAKP